MKWPHYIKFWTKLIKVYQYRIMFRNICISLVVLPNKLISQNGVKHWLKTKLFSVVNLVVITLYPQQFITKFSLHILDLHKTSLFIISIERWLTWIFFLNISPFYTLILNCQNLYISTIFKLLIVIILTNFNPFFKWRNKPNETNNNYVIYTDNYRQLTKFLLVLIKLWKF